MSDGDIPLTLFRRIIGILLVLYGVGKIIVSTAVFVLPEKYSKYIPFLKHDKSPAGIAIDVVLFVFGIYTILHGLAILGLLFASWILILDNIITVYVLYTLLGIFMLTFFILIVYTNAPIPSDPKNMLTYEIVGVGGGILFLQTVAALVMWENFGYNQATGFALTIFLVLTALLAFVIYNAIQSERVRRKTPDNVKISVTSELITLAMVPLGGVV